MFTLPFSLKRKQAAVTPEPDTIDKQIVRKTRTLAEELLRIPGIAHNGLEARAWDTGLIKDPGNTLTKQLEEASPIPRKDRNHWYSLIRERLMKAGYDGIVYLNRYEIPGWGVPDYKEAAELSDAAFKKRYKDAEDCFITFTPQGKLVDKPAHP